MHTVTKTPSSPRYLELITGFFVGFILISNLASTRIIAVGPLEFDAGTLMFPLTYIIGDVLTEVYGFARNRRVIWTGFFTLFLATFLLWLVSIFPPASGWNNDPAWQSVMGLMPRLAIGSLLAYLVGDFANAIILAKMKARRPHKSPAWRFVASTLAGQAFDTFIFASIAFLGVLDAKLWWILVLSNFVFKVGIEIILLPFTLFIVRKIKEYEDLDAVDLWTSYNPFQWNVRHPSEAIHGAERKTEPPAKQTAETKAEPHAGQPEDDSEN
ncbi:MAG: queuosine precursor transporter [Deltaproteobacteria bacterium]|jgi:uncharacterized integral membrane protein (TIGR00697 family)|nr:queuosine precursor transporter [Deltaproteobacteria bacterium]